MAEERKKRHRRPPPVESKPIIGGRLWIPIAMIGLLALIANPKFNNYVVRKYAPKVELTNTKKWKIGESTEVKVTLITADYARLMCAHGKEVDGAHCAYEDEKRRWPRDPAGPLDDNKATEIQPYRTSPDNRLILLVGLWATPEVGMRLHREPPRGVAEKKLHRFEATCNIRFVGEIEDIKLRWEVGQRWQSEKKAFVAKPLTCTVSS